jgi:hypothetical protein
MAQTLYYGNNKSTNLPGVYTEFVSGVNNQPISASFGNILVIDTGKGSSGYRGSGFSGGAGIDGTLLSAIDSIQEFNSINDYRKSIKGSELWLLADPLFQPQGAGNGQGVPKVFFAKAATTSPAEIEYTYTGGGSNGGVFNVQVRDEGYVGNGFEYNQTYATSTTTISNAGATTDTFTLKVSGVTVATYTNASSDNIVTVIAGLAASAASIGLVTVSTTTSTTIVITAPNFLTGVLANAVTPTLEVTGTAAGTPAQFTGGADGTTLTRGYAAVMRAGTLDTSKFAIDFYVGTYKGADSESDAWDYISEALATPKRIATSVEFNNVATLYTWAANDSTFQSYFKVQTSSTAGTGAVTAADLAANLGNNLAVGGIETYSTANVDLVLDAVTDLDYTFVLALDNDANAQSADNSKILTHLTTEAKYRKFMIVGGDNDDILEGSGSSSETAAFYDSERVIVVHSGVGLRRRGATGFKNRSSLYKASLVVGRIAGQAPQVPLTFKRLKFDKDIHELNKVEQTKAINNGVLATVFDADFGGYIVLQGINSKQTNDFTIADDGSSFEISIESIKAQLSKEIEINAKLQLLGQAVGVNRNTLKPVDVKSWLETFLTLQEATETTDNLITSSSNIVVSVVGDTYNVSFDFQPSFPVNKILIIGRITDLTL